MTQVQIYNSLSRKKEIFEPVNSSEVTIYTCGPTVYDYQHIGNLRTATLMDVTTRALRFLGYNVKSIMNITDVEDKIERRAAELSVTVDEITHKYEQIYYDCLKKLNIQVDSFPHASEHVKEQIEIIKVLEKRGFTYNTDFGVYFDTSKDADYGKLGNTAKSDKAKSRIELTDQKKNSSDFVLWRIPKEGEARQKLWNSPWGVGYPGWHIECSAMSMKGLSADTFSVEGDVFYPEKFHTIDIHLGGEDLKEVHHENEIAQSESATGHSFVKYWMHGAMLNVDKEKMSKSLGNFLTLKTIEDKGIEPQALRLLYFSAHYRKELTFTWDALEGAQTSLNKLRAKYSELSQNNLVEIKSDAARAFVDNFKSAISDDFNMPVAIAIFWEVINSTNVDNAEKFTLLTEFNKVIGLDLSVVDFGIKLEDLPANVAELISNREEARKNKDWAKADELRKKIEEAGYQIKDSADGILVTRKIDVK